MAFDRSLAETPTCPAMSNMPLRTLSIWSTDSPAEVTSREVEDWYVLAILTDSMAIPASAAVDTAAAWFITPDSPRAPAVAEAKPGVARFRLVTRISTMFGTSPPSPLPCPCSLCSSAATALRPHPRGFVACSLRTFPELRERIGRTSVPVVRRQRLHRELHLLERLARVGAYGQRGRHSRNGLRPCGNDRHDHVHVLFP